MTWRRRTTGPQAPASNAVTLGLSQVTASARLLPTSCPVMRTVAVVEPTLKVRQSVQPRFVWSQPLAAGEAGWLHESAAELASGTVTGRVARHLRVESERAEETIVGRLRGAPLVIEDAVGAGVTEVGDAVGEAHGGSPGKTAWGRHLGRLPGPKV